MALMASVSQGGQRSMLNVMVIPPSVGHSVQTENILHSQLEDGMSGERLASPVMDSKPTVMRRWRRKRKGSKEARLALPALDPGVGQTSSIQRRPVFLPGCPYRIQ